MKKIIHTDHAPQAVGPYSQAVRLNDFLFCSGQIAIDPKTEIIIVSCCDTRTEVKKSTEPARTYLNAYPTTLYKRVNNTSAISQPFNEMI